MSGIEEAIALASGILCVVGMQKLSKKVGYKISKRKLKKLLIEAFDLLDIPMMEKAIINMKDFDSKHQTKKLDKTINKILSKKPDLNKENVRRMVTENNFTSIEDIFSQTQDEKKEEEDFVSEQLLAIERKRQDIIQRKQDIRNKLMAKEKKLQRRNVGGMG